jgi:hypothetical protein
MKEYLMLAFGANNREIVGKSVVLVPSAARSAAGNGASLDTGERSTLRLLLDVAAVSGLGATTTVTVEQSSDGMTWRSHSSFAAAAAVGTERKVFGPLDRVVRVSWTVGGTTPSVTFSVTGELV